MTTTKRFFFSYSFSRRQNHLSDYREVKSLLESQGHTCYCFVYDFDKKASPQELMDHALYQIDQSDVLVADPVYSSFGIGIEAGYAKARGKEIIYLHKVGTEQEETLSGISDNIIDYSSYSEVTDWFQRYAQK
jgi:2'-deoxynucleoside 5'-phosphate N-hydrolase